MRKLETRLSGNFPEVDKDLYMSLMTPTVKTVIIMPGRGREWNSAGSGHTRGGIFLTYS